MIFLSKSWPGEVREVILVKFLCQDNGLFLFEIVCFITTTEKIDFFYNENAVVSEEKRAFTERTPIIPISEWIVY